MITEDYISFEVAKLLKEKGFEPPHDYMKCLPIMYTGNGEIKWGVWSDDWYPRITLQMAMKWLREAHNIILNIFYCDNAWCSEYYGKDDSTIIGSDYETYEEACESGIKYALEKLI